MGIIVSGRLFSLVTMVSVAIVYIYLLKRSNPPMVRKIAAIDAIEEALGRCSELGLGIHFTPGIKSFSPPAGSETVAGISVLGHIARRAANLDLPLYVSIGNSAVTPVATETVRQSYILEGAVDNFREEMILYYGADNNLYEAGMYGLVSSGIAGAHINIGAIKAGGSFFTNEMASIKGMITINGTAEPFSGALLLISSDYMLIGEELFAISGYLSKNPTEAIGLQTQDIIKIIGLIILILGSLLFTIGFPIKELLSV